MCSVIYSMNSERNSTKKSVVREKYKHSVQQILYGSFYASNFIIFLMHFHTEKPICGRLQSIALRLLY